MFLLSRRQTRTALAAGAGAAVYLAASELGKDRLKLTGLFVLASASMAGMATAKASAKAYSAHQRIDNLVPVVATASSTASAAQTTANNALPKSGGTISGALTVTGNHTVQGTLHGTGGTLTIGDDTHLSSSVLTADGTITSHAQILGATTTGDAAQGSAPATYAQSALQATINRVNDLLAALG